MTQVCLSRQESEREPNQNQRYQSPPLIKLGSSITLPSLASIDSFFSAPMPTKVYPKTREKKQKTSKTKKSAPSVTTASQLSSLKASLWGLQSVIGPHAQTAPTATTTPPAPLPLQTPLQKAPLYLQKGKQAKPRTSGRKRKVVDYTGYESADAEDETFAPKKKV